MVEINNLRYGYASTPVLNDLNLNVTKGTLHGILGKNGSGKTTLFNLMYKTLKEDSGKITFENQPLHHGSIAFLETENYFYPYMKGIEYIKLIGGVNAKVEEWNTLFTLPLYDFIEHYSTGMKKKLALMAVLTLDRPILILDEPFNGVDLETSERIFMLLRALKGKKTIFISSHILDSLTRCCDHISILEHGKIKETLSQNRFNSLYDTEKEEEQKYGALLSKLLE